MASKLKNFVDVVTVSPVKDAIATLRDCDNPTLLGNLARAETRQCVLFALYNHMNRLGLVPPASARKAGQHVEELKAAIARKAPARTRKATRPATTTRKAPARTRKATRASARKTA
jgi:hypothetical protein